MRTFSLLVLGLSVLGACEQWTPVNDAGTSCAECKCPAQPDLLSVTPAPKCAAAKGLPGDNLLCVDFSSIPDGPLGNQPPAKLDKWDFVSNCGGMYWEIASGKLQIKNFSTFMSNCGFLMPTTDLTTAANQKYNSITLSVIHKVQIDDTQQRVQIMLGADDPSLRLLDQTTGKQQRQRTMIEVARTDLPVIVAGNFQPLFKLYSGITIGLAGWQIESIAVNASP